MDEDTEPSEYWCHFCSQAVNPIVEIEAIKCPICQSGFVEEISSAGHGAAPTDPTPGDSDPDRALHLWAPILLGMLGNRSHRSRFSETEHETREEEADLDRELESLTRRTRSTAALLELLRAIRAEISSGSVDPNRDNGERAILLNPFNRAHDDSLGDYFVGPGFEALLQHLADNDQNRHGTPPAKKEAVEALATVRVEEAKQCSVCLDDLEIGAEAKEMPCKHRFHGGCLLPWLELHSSCPVCRFQLPCDESKNDDNVVNGGGESSSGEFSLTLPWPFNSLFSSSSGNENLSSSSRNEPSGER